MRRWLQAIDLAGGVVTIKNGKGGKQRRVHLSGSLLEALVALGPSSGRLFRFTDVRERQRLLALAKKADVAYHGHHALRHYAGTRLARQTKDLEQVARHLEHSSLETARVYAKFADETLKEAVKGW